MSVLGGDLDTLAGELLEGKEVERGGSDDDLCGSRNGQYAPPRWGYCLHCSECQRTQERRSLRRTGSLNVDVGLVELVNELGEGREVTVHCEGRAVSTSGPSLAAERLRCEGTECTLEVACEEGKSQHCFGKSDTAMTTYLQRKACGRKRPF